MRPCHRFPPDEGYDEARRLLKKTFGDEYQIASAYETKALDWPNIKPEDGTALNRFSIFLASCKNALSSNQYISKFDQPGNIQKLVFNLPYNLRVRWRRTADDIMEVQSRPVESSDLVMFVDREARIAANPVFGKIFNSTKSAPGSRPPGNKTPKPRSLSLLAQLKGDKRPPEEQLSHAHGDQSSRARGGQSLHSQVEHSSGTDPVLPSRSHQCLYCSRNHTLEDCNALRWSNKLCFGCLSNQHILPSEEGL